MTDGPPPRSRDVAEAPLLRGAPLVAVAAATVLVLGLNWPVMAWGLESIPPLWLTAARLLGAGAGLAAILAVAGRLRRPPRSDLPVVASVAILRLAVVYGLVFSALMLVAPGRASMLVHTSGLWAAPLAAWLLGEWLGARTVAGLLVGVLGIVLLVEPWSMATTGDDLVGYAMLLAAAVATALASLHVRAHRWTATPLELMPWQLLIAGCLVVPIALLVHGLPALDVSPQEVIVVAYQVVLASGVGIWGVLTLARSLPAATAGAVWMAVPVVGVASSVLLVSEPVTATALAGMVLVSAGVWVVVVRRPGGRARAPAPLPVSPGEAAR